jgi:uncharacterized protein (UPF0147 family)
MENLNELIEMITELTEDSSVPRNVKDKLKSINSILTDESREKYISINEAKDILAEISEDQNLQTFSRTQLWNISSMLEEIRPKV